MSKETEMTDKELDIAIAKHVFGANLTPTENISVSTPAFSTTGDGMLAVVERMRERGFENIIIEIEFHTTDWHVYFGEPAGKNANVYDDTLPRAVCVAALRALGVNV